MSYAICSNELHRPMRDFIRVNYSIDSPFNNTPRDIFPLIQFYVYENLFNDENFDLIDVINDNNISFLNWLHCNQTNDVFVLLANQLCTNKLIYIKSTKMIDWFVNNYVEIFERLVEKHFYCSIEIYEYIMHDYNIDHIMLLHYAKRMNDFAMIKYLYKNFKYCIQVDLTESINSNNLKMIDFYLTIDVCKDDIHDYDKECWLLYNCSYETLTYILNIPNIKINIKKLYISALTALKNMELIKKLDSYDFVKDIDFEDILYNIREWKCNTSECYEIVRYIMSKIRKIINLDSFIELVTKTVKKGFLILLDIVIDSLDTIVPLSTMLRTTRTTLTTTTTETSTTTITIETPELLKTSKIPEVLETSETCINNFTGLNTTEFFDQFGYINVMDIIYNITDVDINENKYLPKIIFKLFRYLLKQDMLYTTLPDTCPISYCIIKRCLCVNDLNLIKYVFENITVIDNMRYGGYMGRYFINIFTIIPADLYDSDIFRYVSLHTVKYVLDNNILCIERLLTCIEDMDDKKIFTYIINNYTIPHSTVYLKCLIKYDYCDVIIEKNILNNELYDRSIWETAVIYNRTKIIDYIMNNYDIGVNAKILAHISNNNNIVLLERILKNNKTTLLNINYVVLDAFTSLDFIKIMYKYNYRLSPDIITYLIKSRRLDIIEYMLCNGLGRSELFTKAHFIEALRYSVRISKYLHENNRITYDENFMHQADSYAIVRYLHINNIGITHEYETDMTALYSKLPIISYLFTNGIKIVNNRHPDENDRSEFKNTLDLSNYDEIIKYIHSC